MEEVYRQFLEYDWDNAEFQQGLEEILASYLVGLQEQDPAVTAIPAAARHQLVQQAKSYFFCSNTGNILNLEDYEEWRRRVGAAAAAPAAAAAAADSDMAGGGTAAGDGDVGSDVDSGSAAGSAASSAAGSAEVSAEASAPPYSSNYQQLVNLIVLGQPVPGIKTIDDTVLPEQSSAPQHAARVKPWEK